MKRERQHQIKSISTILFLIATPLYCVAPRLSFTHPVVSLLLSLLSLFSFTYRVSFILHLVKPNLSHPITQITRTFTDSHMGRSGPVLRP